MGVKAILLLFALSPVAAPTNYSIHRTDSPPSIDGNLSDWGEGYLIDSIRSDDNVYARDSSTPWSPDDFQMKVYMSWADSFVYFCVKIVRDDIIIPSSGCGYNGDNLEIKTFDNPWFYFTFKGYSYCSPSYPFSYKPVQDSVLIDNDGLPTYEFSIIKDILDPFGMGLFQLSIGSQEVDYLDLGDVMCLAIGAKYTGLKQDWENHPWDNPLYYPTFNLSGSIQIETKSVEIENANILISPNPFNPAACIEYRLGSAEKGNLTIHDISGAKVFSKEVKDRGKVVWNATGYSTGVYFCRLSWAGKSISKKLIFSR